MAEKTVKIGNQEVKLKTSAYTPILYAKLFNENIFEEMAEIIGSASKTGSVPFSKILTLYRLVYCMAKHADPSLPKMEEWMDNFAVYDIPEIASDLIGLWAAENENQSIP